MAEQTTRFSITLAGPLSRRPGDARRWVADRCAELRFECGDGDLPILVSELVTNACVHGADPITLRVELCRSWARVEVEDSLPALPAMQSPGERDPNGRGLLIVNLLSHIWGTEKTVTGGKLVWAEVFFDEPVSAALERVGCK